VAAVCASDACPSTSRSSFQSFEIVPVPSVCFNGQPQINWMALVAGRSGLSIPRLINKLKPDAARINFESNAFVYSQGAHTTDWRIPCRDLQD
jgi:hypothetical protein